MRDALQKLIDICSSNEHCQSCPLFNYHATVMDEMCRISAPPRWWDLNAIMDSLEKEVEE